MGAPIAILPFAALFSILISTAAAASPLPELRRLTDLGAIAWAPRFQLSGGYLTFATNPHGFANFELWIVGAQGTKEPVRITDHEEFNSLAAFTPDGARSSRTSNATPDGESQFLIGARDHEAARAG